MSYDSVSIGKDFESCLDFRTMIRRKLERRGQSLEQAISLRKLYLRISVIGLCNLHCTFCHNEGAPKREILDLELACKVMEAAFRIGYRRVQFVGGEPLLHPAIGRFVREARTHYADVGITTNGKLLSEKLGGLIEAGISRIHVSLQREVLRENTADGTFGVPAWFPNMLELIFRNKIPLRVNLPVATGDIDKFGNVIRELLFLNCNIEVYPILSPTEDHYSDTDYVRRLTQLVGRQNQQRRQAPKGGSVSLRSYLHPQGIRCSQCDSEEVCREASRSLRMGADRVLRPCLASRKWDITISEEVLLQQIEEASLYSIDFIW